MEAYILGRVDDDKLRIYDRTKSARVKIYDYNQEDVYSAIMDKRIQINNAYTGSDNSLIVNGSDYAPSLNLKEREFFLIQINLISDDDYELEFADTTGVESNMLISKFDAYDDVYKNIPKFINAKTNACGPYEKGSIIISDTVISISDDDKTFKLVDKREPSKEDKLAFSRFKMANLDIVDTPVNAAEVAKLLKREHLLKSGKEVTSVALNKNVTHPPICITDISDIEKLENGQALIAGMEQEALGTGETGEMPSRVAVVINSLAKVYPPISLSAQQYTNILSYWSERGKTTKWTQHLVDSYSSYSVNVLDVNKCNITVKQRHDDICMTHIDYLINVTYRGRIIASFASGRNYNNEEHLDRYRLDFSLFNIGNGVKSAEYARLLEKGDVLMEEEYNDEFEGVIHRSSFMPIELSNNIMESIYRCMSLYIDDSRYGQIITPTGWLLKTHSSNGITNILESKQAKSVDIPFNYTGSDTHVISKIKARDSILKIASRGL